MNFVERILELEKQEQKVRNDVTALGDSLDYGKWSFCLHVHCGPLISAWKRGDDISIGAVAAFTVKQDSVELCSPGAYHDNWQEAEKILNTRLVQKFNEQPGETLCTL